MSGLLDRLFGVPPQTQPAPAPNVFDDTFTASLESRVSGGYFDGIFSSRWTSRGSYSVADRDWLRDTMLRRARAVTQEVSVAQFAATEITINSRLQQLLTAETGHVGVVSAFVRLNATPEAQKAAAQWESLQTQLALSEMNARLEVERLRHLRDDIFMRPEVARTYWLDRHPESFDGALDDRFERIAEKLGSVPGPSTTAIAHLLRDFLMKLNMEQRITLLGSLGSLFEAFGRTDLRDQLPPELL